MADEASETRPWETKSPAVGGTLSWSWAVSRPACISPAKDSTWTLGGQETLSVSPDPGRWVPQAPPTLSHIYTLAPGTGSHLRMWVFCQARKGGCQSPTPRWALALAAFENIKVEPPRIYLEQSTLTHVHEGLWDRSVHYSITGGQRETI